MSETITKKEIAKIIKEKGYYEIPEKTDGYKMNKIVEKLDERKVYYELEERKSKFMIFNGIKETDEDIDYSRIVAISDNYENLKKYQNDIEKNIEVNSVEDLYIPFLRINKWKPTERFDSRMHRRKAIMDKKREIAKKHDLEKDVIYHTFVFNNNGVEAVFSGEKEEAINKALNFLNSVKETHIRVLWYKQKCTFSIYNLHYIGGEIINILSRYRADGSNSISTQELKQILENNLTRGTEGK